MNPVELATTAVAFVAASFGSSFAQEAGKSAWQLIQAVSRVVTTRLSTHDEQLRALAELEAAPDDPVKYAAVVRHLCREIEDDKPFAADLARLVRDASAQEAGKTLIAKASGNAKQANFIGDNLGSITFS